MPTLSDLQQDLEKWLTNNSRHNVPTDPVFKLNEEMRKVLSQYNPNQDNKIITDGYLYILKHIEAISFKSKTSNINTVYDMLQNNQ